MASEPTWRASWVRHVESDSPPSGNRPRVTISGTRYNIAAVAHHLRADLDQLFLQTRQRPILDRLRRRQRTQEIAEVVGERMKLEPHRIGGERSARQSRPLDRAFALLDLLLARPALVV